jgi:hypothetical protein
MRTENDSGPHPTNACINEAKRAALEVRSSPRRTRDHCLGDVGRVFGAALRQAVRDGKTGSIRW